MNCTVGDGVLCNCGPPSSLAAADQVMGVGYVSGGSRNNDFFPVISWNEVRVKERERPLRQLHKLFPHTGQREVDRDTMSPFLLEMGIVGITQSSSYGL